MAQLMNIFDASQFDPAQSAGSLPVGKHRVIIESSEVKATKANTGGYLELTLQIIDGPNAGQTGAFRLNIYSQSEAAKGIANRQLSAICHAINVIQIQDSAQLHNQPFMVEVALQKGEEAAQKGYTEVKKIFDANGQEPTRNGPRPVAAAPAAPAPTPAAPAAPAPTAWGQAPAAPAPTAWGQAPAAPAAPAWGQAPAAPAAATGAAPWAQAPAAPAGAAPWAQR